MTSESFLKNVNRTQKTSIVPRLKKTSERGDYGFREAYGREKLMLGAILARFDKTNARAQTVARFV